MKDDTQRGLVLLGHGSMVSADTAAPVYAAARRMQQTGRFSDVRVAFWKEPPYLADAIVQVQATHVTIVPMFMASGYFTTRVLPRELEHVSAMSGVSASTYMDAVGEHVSMFDVLCDIIDGVVMSQALDLDTVAVVVVGHGTTKHAKSSALVRQHVASLRERYGVTVCAAFLDEAPHVAQVMPTLDASDVIVLPFFMANGYHTTLDIPEALGIEFGVYPAKTAQHTVWYDGAIGLHPKMDEVVQARATREPASRAELTDPQSGCWASMILVYLRHWLCAGSLSLGQVKVVACCERGEEGYWVYDHAAALAECDVLTVDALSSRVRGSDGARRGVPYLNDLPGGWRLWCSTLEAVQDALEMIYPSLLLHRVLWAQGALRVESARDVLSRQTGRYRGLADLSPVVVAQVCHAVCSGCIKEPVWAGARAAGAPCRRMCPGVLEALHHKVER